jgi:hypothetical protein
MWAVRAQRLTHPSVVLVNMHTTSATALQQAKQPARPLVRRGDVNSFVKLLELDPEADSDNSLFGLEVCISILVLTHCVIMYCIRVQLHTSHCIFIMLVCAAVVL